jgi:hypothetical protein
MSAPADSASDKPSLCPRCHAPLPHFGAGAGPEICPACGMNLNRVHSPEAATPGAGPIAARQPATRPADHAAIDHADEFSLEPPIKRPMPQWFSDDEIAARAEPRPNSLSSRTRPPAAPGQLRSSRGKPTKTYDEQLADLTADEAAPPRIAYEPDAAPEHPFFSGVFQFPWREGVWPRWLGMSLALATSGAAWVTTLVSSGLLVGNDVSSGIVAGLVIGLPSIAITALTMAYLSACLLAVIEDTSDGCDTIHAWPPGDIAEWFWTLPVPLVAGLAAAIAGTVVKQLAGGAWNAAAVLTVTAIFPIALLSILETGSPWLPVSGPVGLTLVRSWRSWLLFYAETSALVGIWYGLARWLLGKNPYVAVAILAPLLAAVLLIYVRLLGRLAWFTSLEPDEADPDDPGDSESNGGDPDAEELAPGD